MLTVGGNIVVSLGLRGLPKAEDKVVTVVDALGDAVAGRPVPPGRLSAQVEYLGHHVAAPIAGAVLVALGTLALFLPLAYLYRATRARNPALGQWVLVLLAIGTVLYGVGNLTVSLNALPGRPRLPARRRPLEQRGAGRADPPPYAAGTALTFAGSVALLFGLAVTSLNAMRVGLLTRFMGILGMIVAATFLLPLDQLGIIRSLWLVRPRRPAAGPLALGRAARLEHGRGGAVAHAAGRARGACPRPRRGRRDGDADPGADAPRAPAAADGAPGGRAPAPRPAAAPRPARRGPRSAAQPSSRGGAERR